MNVLCSDEEESVLSVVVVAIEGERFAFLRFTSFAATTSSQLTMHDS